VPRRLHDSGRDIILLSEAQIREFAGNVLELSTREGGRRLALSAPTIERAGGSVRCMLAGIHLAPRPTGAD